MAAVDVVDAYVGAFEGAGRRVAEGEWGLTVPAEAAGGWPLEVGVRVSDGMLRAQAPVVEFDETLDPWMLLWWNRQTRYVRFASTRSREIWVHADLPVNAVDERMLDRLLGLLVEGAVAVRSHVQQRT